MSKKSSRERSDSLVVNVGDNSALNAKESAAKLKEANEAMMQAFLKERKDIDSQMQSRNTSTDTSNTLVPLPKAAPVSYSNLLEANRVVASSLGE